MLEGNFSTEASIWCWELCCPIPTQPRRCLPALYGHDDSINVALMVVG